MAREGNWIEIGSEWGIVIPNFSIELMAVIRRINAQAVALRRIGPEGEVVLGKQ